jgi:hypothetical protein
MARVRSVYRSESVTVLGLRELQRGLASAAPQFRTLLGQVNKTVAESLVAAPARALAASLGRGQVRLARAGVIKAGGTARAATVSLNDTAAVPDSFAGEFGRDRPAGWNRPRAGGHAGQFRPWRGNAYEHTWEAGSGGAGYALFPTIRRQTGAIIDAYLTTIDRALAEVVR